MRGQTEHHQAALHQESPADAIHPAQEVPLRLRDEPGRQVRRPLQVPLDARHDALHRRRHSGRRLCMLLLCRFHLVFQ